VDEIVVTHRRKPGTAFEPVGGVTPEVTPEVKRLLHAMKGAMPRREIQEKLVLKDDVHFREAYLNPALDAGIIEMTIPDKPNSPQQKYRLTPKGKGMRTVGEK
jgi:hypothetical protein